MAISKEPNQTPVGNGPQWTGHYGVAAKSAPKPKAPTKPATPPPAPPTKPVKPSKAPKPTKAAMPDTWKPLPHISDADRLGLVERLKEAYRMGKIKVVQVAEAGKCKSSSASCWLRGVSLPTADKIPALEELLKKAKAA